ADARAADARHALGWWLAALAARQTNRAVHLRAARDRRADRARRDLRAARQVLGVSTDFVLELYGVEVTVTNPDKVFFPRLGKTKLDLVNYYLSVAEAALRGVAQRPMNLKRDRKSTRL